MKKLIALFIVSVLTLSLQTDEQSDDFSSPKAVVETFIRAAEKQEVEELSSCFSNRSPGEWDAIRNKTISSDDLDELKNFASGARVSNVEKKGASEAIVYVTFQTRNEEIRTVKEGDRWFILDF